MIGENFASLIYTGPQYRFLILSRSRIKRAQFEEPFLVISVSNPGLPEATLPDTPHCKAILRLQFHDTESERCITVGHMAVTERDAERILQFIEKHKDEAVLIVCQCEAGISRSAAIAAALSRILQQEDAFFFAHYAPNKLVYNTLLKVNQRLASTNRNGTEDA